MAEREPRPDEIAAKLRELVANDPMVLHGEDTGWSHFGKVGNIGGVANLPFDQMRPSQNVTEYSPPNPRIAEAFGELGLNGLGLTAASGDDRHDPTLWWDTSGNKPLREEMWKRAGTRQQADVERAGYNRELDDRAGRHPIYDKDVGRDIDSRFAEAMRRMLPPVREYDSKGRLKR